MRNWKEYNEKLIQRGTIEVDPDLFKNWDKNLRKMNKRKEGNPYKYPDSFIKFIGLLKVRFRLSYRGIHGFLRIFSYLFSVPDYSSIFRRMNCLKLNIEDSLPRFNESLFVSIDASGLQADNGGLWLKKKFKRKKQSWIKIHFAIDVRSKKIISYKVTTDKVHDNRRFRGLVRRAAKKHKIYKVAADPGYDDFRNYELLHNKKIRPAIKPKLNSNPDIWNLTKDERKLHRLKQVLLFQKYKYKTWTKKTGYNYRVLNESVFNSFKCQYGHGVYSKKFHYVVNEIMWKVFSYNQMS